MSSQDLHNLQEAYLDVYELDEAKTPLPVGKMDAKAKELKSKFLKSKPGSPEAGKLISRVSQITATRDSKVVSDSYDLYDIILTHLLDEGYAETQEQAEAIMVNMSEEWRESICEGYVPLRTSDEHYDDEGFPTTTRSWSNKMTDARIGVGKVKDRSRRNSGDPIGNLTKGVSAKKRLDAMKKVDDEPESVRAKRSQAKAAANRQLGTNRRSLQTSLDREHLTKSLKSS